MPSGPRSRRDPDAARKFVEDFGLALADAGMQRMPARVLGALLASESSTMTAGEIAETLQVSPAAVSVAVRYLVSANLAGKARAPGERRDHYYVDQQVWLGAVTRKDSFYDQFAAIADRGVDAVGADTDAGKRLAETRDFFRYISAELPNLVRRWRAERGGN